MLSAYEKTLIIDGYINSITRWQAVWYNELHHLNQLLVVERSQFEYSNKELAQANSSNNPKAIKIANNQIEISTRKINDLCHKIQEVDNKIQDSFEEIQFYRSQR